VRTSSRHVASLSLLLVLSISVACTSSDSASPSPSDEGDAPATSQASSATPPGVDVLDLSDCRAAVCEGSLEPGRYRASFYGRTLDFEFATPGWIWH
jgi:hypothetical protein